MEEKISGFAFLLDKKILCIRNCIFTLVPWKEVDPAEVVIFWSEDPLELIKTLSGEIVDFLNQNEKIDFSKLEPISVERENGNTLWIGYVKIEKPGK